MKKRRLPSAGAVIGLIALFVALGGTVYAAATINGKEIKKNSIPANRIKKKSLTGTQINLAKLGKVPTAAAADTATSAGTASTAKSADTAKTADSAKTADTANSATTATTANTVAQITGFEFKADNGGSGTVLNNFHGLSLFASCESGAEKGLTVKAASSSPEAQIAWTSTWQGSGAGSGTANNSYSQISSTPLTLYTPSGTTKTTNGSVNIGFSVGQIVYSQPNGNTQVTVQWNYNNNITGNDCYWAGTVVSNG